MIAEPPPRILFSSPIRPFGQRYGDAFSCGTNAAFQLTWAQDGFRSEDIMWHWGLDLIAANLRAPTTVIHYPSYHEFVEEIKKQYAYVGISFNTCTFPRLKKMTDAVRRYAPDSKIVLGGYGVVAPDGELQPLCDFICREDGITFMRRLLGESKGRFVHPAVAFDRRFISVKTGERTGIIFSSLGCPHGCDFCITSHFHKQRRIHFLETGRDLVAAMKEAHQREPNLTSFAIMDEDFLLDQARAREFLDGVRRERVFWDIMVFSSIRSISRFDPGDIAEMGISRIWVGFEGLQAGYTKLEGKPFREMVEDLRAYGVSVVASMIIGYDYQDETTIREEFRQVLGSKPTATQVMLFTPCRGTPAWDRLEREGRLDLGIRQDYGLHDGYTLLYKHPHLSRENLETLVNDLCVEEYETLGPSVFRFIDTILTGYQNLAGSDKPLLRQRAEAFRSRLRRSLPLFHLGLRFAPNPAVRSRIEDLYRRVTACVGPMETGQRLLGRLLVPFYRWSRFRYRHERFMQPRMMKNVYDAI